MLSGLPRSIQTSDVQSASSHNHKGQETLEVPRHRILAPFLIMEPLQPASHILLPSTEAHHNPFEIFMNPLYDATDFVDYSPDYSCGAFGAPPASTGPILMQDHHHHSQWRNGADNMDLPSGSPSVASTFAVSDHISSRTPYHPLSGIFDADSTLDQLYIMSDYPSPTDIHPPLSSGAPSPFDMPEVDSYAEYFVTPTFEWPAAPQQPSISQSQVPSPITPSEPVHGLGGQVFSWRIPPKLQNAAAQLEASDEFRNNGVIPTHLLRPFLKKIRHAPEVRMQLSGKGSRNGAFAYKCLWDNCDRLTTRRDHAHDHIAQHLGSRPHKCPYCSLRFLRLADCKRHAKSIEHDGVKNEISLVGLEVWAQCHTMGYFSASLIWGIFARLVRGVARFLRECPR